MTSLLLLKIIYVLANFLVFIRDFTIYCNKYFSLHVYFKENLDTGY